jgi:HSP20 family protein
MWFAFFDLKRRKIMKENNNILKEIINQIDMFNTLNGGVSMTTVGIKQTEDNYMINVKTPGISPEAYHVEVVNNQLVLYALMDVNPKQGESQAKVPSFVRTFLLPYYVDTDNIEATYEDNELKVVLPFTRKMSSTPKIINIKFE